jgi:hypothetical protein
MTDFSKPARPDLSAAARLLSLFILMLLVAPTPAKADLLDGFDSVDAWQIIPAPGAAANLHGDSGNTGQGLRIDYDFSQGGGEIIVHKAFPLTLPDNFVLSFDVRAQGWKRGLELRLVDASGQNVWRFRDAAPRIGPDWQDLKVKRRRFAFAWGPAAGGNPQRLGLIEFVIPRGSGGSGSLWIDNLRLEPRPAQQARAATPVISASEGAPSPNLLAEDRETAWRARGSDKAPWLQLDFLAPREYGGLTLDWDPDDFATAYTVETSNDGQHWQRMHEITQGNGGRDYLPLPECESRYLRLLLQRSSRGHGYGIRHVTLQPLEFSNPPERLFERLAQDSPRGFYPRYFSGQQTHWTLVGTSGDPTSGADCEALLSEDGILEAHGARFSVEPFLKAKGALHTWADGDNQVSLEQGYLPIPSVKWERSALTLAVNAVASAQPPGCVVHLRYRVTNRSSKALPAVLFLAVRPLPVTPPWQALVPEAAISPIHGLRYIPGMLEIDGVNRVLTWPKPDGAGVGGLESEPLAAAMIKGEAPKRTIVRDELGFASAALRYDLKLGPGQAREVVLTLPPAGGSASLADASDFQRRLDTAARHWHEELDRVELKLPPGEKELGLALKSNLAYILINRSGPAVRPGSRRYGRTWVRDGAVASAGLLALGHATEARVFLDWLASYQRPDGSIPCCLDAWGPDAMIEHDSAGEFLYAAANDYEYSHDLGFLRAIWPKLAKAAEYLESLRAQRLTAAYQTGEDARFYGLLPESASHEGYMARPVHSYWDDFWALRGLDDAARLATVLGDPRAARFAAQRDGLRESVHKSIARTQAQFGIDFVPGAAELGDFDPTSSAIAVTVAGESEGPLRASLLQTFARFDTEIRDRQAGRSNWQAYAPYELRNVAALVRLGEREAAYRALSYLFEGRRPPPWNQWPEVVWRDLRVPRFLGDMPHSWIGAEYIQALLSMFVYADPQRRLVLAAGLPAAWLNTPGGVGIRNLVTPYGKLGYRIEAAGPDRLMMHIEEGIKAPPGGLTVALPGLNESSQVRINGSLSKISKARFAVEQLPAEIEIRTSTR